MHASVIDCTEPKHKSNSLKFKRITKNENGYAERNGTGLLEYECAEWVNVSSNFAAMVNTPTVQQWRHGVNGGGAGVPGSAGKAAQNSLAKIVYD